MAVGPNPNGLRPDGGNGFAVGQAGVNFQQAERRLQEMTLFSGW